MCGRGAGAHHAPRPTSHGVHGGGRARLAPLLPLRPGLVPEAGQTAQQFRNQQSKESGKNVGKHLQRTRLAVAVAMAFGHLGAAWAADEGVEKQLGEMVVQGGKDSAPAVPANLPATVESVTARQIDQQVNAVTAAETLKYLPSIVVRERYIGDRNGIVSTRTSGTVSSANSIVYADGLLLSNFLGNSYSYPPRWGMVSPEEIDRVDMIYGPFSALYPGNAMGGVVLMSTRMPTKFEAHASIQGFQERFKLYGTDETNNGTHATASLGNKVGDLSFWLSADHLNTHGHPMSFGTAGLKGGAGGTTVTGAYRDLDQNGAPRVVTGAYSIDHTVQDNGKLKLAYDFSPTLRATYTLGLWQNTSDTAAQTYLRDVNGNPYYNTPTGQYVSIGGQRYTVSGVNPGHSESEHLMQAFSLKSNTGGEWDGEALVSTYHYDKDMSRTAANVGTDSGLGTVRPGGQATYMDGTGWDTLDLRGEWRPGGSLASAHQVSFGYHYDLYALRSRTYNVASDWLRGSLGALTSSSFGNTRTQAVYLQDAWRFKPDWKVVLGGRLENWNAYGGSNSKGAATQNYANRDQTNFSPKLALFFQATPDWELRASLGKAYRYPTVSELFQTTSLGGVTTLQNDPNLKPEQVVSTELTAMRGLKNGLWRVSLFQEDKRDALYSQTDTTVSPSVTSIQNIDKIRTQGVETALQMTDLWVRGLDLAGSVTYAHSKILEDARNPAVAGNIQPRIPNWRATLVGTYRPSARLSYTLAARYSGRQYNSLGNTDSNPDTYGGASRFLVVDAKVNYQLARQWSASVGVDNLNNYKYFVSPHPYPQRTFFAKLKFDY